MRLVIGAGAAAVALTAAATVAWVDVLDDDRTPVAAAAQVRYAPPKVGLGDGVSVDRAEVTAFVDQATNDPRGWRTDLSEWTVWIVQPGVGGTTGMGGRIGEAHPEHRLILVTDEAWTTLGPKFAAAGGDLNDQRTWIVLHELGHLLGHQHTPCPGSGPAPVMRDTNYELGDGCTYNVWPNP